MRADSLPGKIGTIHVFPLDRRSALVRSTAQTLLKKNKTQGQAYWSRLCTKLRSELRVQGVDKATITQQLERLTRAVQVEVSRQLYQPRMPNNAA